MKAKNNRLYTILCIVLAAILSFGATIVGVVATQVDIYKRADCSVDLKADLKDVCNSQNPMLAIKYGGSDLNCGVIMTKSQTRSKPTSVSAAQVDADTTYTLLMVDPDAPGSSIDSLTFYLHWAVSGIRLAVDTDPGKWKGVKKEYAGPSPPPQDAKRHHRYQFILLEEPSGNSNNIQTLSNRAGFKLGEFMGDNNLCRVSALFQFQVPTKEF